MTIHFSKLQSLGNDFLIIDKSSLDFSLTANAIERLCQRNYGVGADGLILFEKKKDDRASMEFFNADGSCASMCGNGLRCLFLETKVEQIETRAGLYQGFVDGNVVSMIMPLPEQKGRHKIKIDESFVEFYWINSGVEHVVLEVDDLSDKTLFDLARKIRYHSYFFPAGVNVNFIQRKKPTVMRTYERGVENFTLACGTGALAVFSILDKEELRLQFYNGGFCDFKMYSDHVFMKAEAKKVFEGKVKKAFLL